MRSHLIAATMMLALTGCALPIPAQIPPEKPSGTLLFQDDFSSPTSGWDRKMYDQGVMDYDGGGYRILVNQPEVMMWSTPHKAYTDVRLEVDAGKLGGPDNNRLGLFCRSTGPTYYFFIIGSDGYYGLGLFGGGRAALLGQATMQRSDSIVKGTAVNHLRLDCKGSTLSGYVNGVLVQQVDDSTLTRGEIGLLAGTFDQPGADTVFDNFVALQP